MQKDTRLSREDTIFLYKDDAVKLMQFYNWVKKNSGMDLSGVYTGDEIEKSSMAVPIYDSTLLSFIKTAKDTEFMNRNYIYTYSRLRIKTPEQEIKEINRATFVEIKVIGDILSYYCYKGDVRGATWNEGLKNGVYLAILDKLKELLEIRNV